MKTLLLLIPCVIYLAGSSDVKNTMPMPNAELVLRATDHMGSQVVTGIIQEESFAVDTNGPKVASFEETESAKNDVQLSVSTDGKADNVEPAIRKGEVVLLQSDNSASQVDNPSDAAKDYIKPLNSLLNKYVNSKGNVDYVGLSQVSDKLDAICDMLSEIGEPSSGRSAQLAYYINLYNAYTLKLIVDNYPVSSITDLYGGKPWDRQWIKVGAKTLSLNAVENDIIRPRFGDARIHFAVNCAAASCPPLLNAAYQPSTLDAQLDSQTRAFVNNADYNSISKSSISISKIFEWYAKDFGSIRDFVNKYSAASISNTASITYAEYDWSLNKQ